MARARFFPEEVRRKQLDAPTKAAAAATRRFGRYEVQRLIGEGAMGKVFLALDPVLNRQVAIKVIAVGAHLDDTTRREFLSRFSLEARLSAQLNHPSIVPVYDAGEDDGVPWIAFQYVDGVTLDKIIKNHGKLSLKWALHIALDIASALHQAHQQQVIHRDVKPANIIVDRHGGIAKLTDFGVAKVPWASFTCEGNCMGSPGYMSPEQVEGAALDERSDLFSLGVVLYEMITGVHPFVRDTVAATAYATISGKFTPASAIVNGPPPQFDTILAQCLDPNPATRTPTAAKLIGLLQTVVPAGNGQGSLFEAPGVKAKLWGQATVAFLAFKTAALRIMQKRSSARRPAELGKTWTRVQKPSEAAPWPYVSRLLRRNRSALLIAAAGSAAVLIAVLSFSVMSPGAKLSIPLDGLDNSEKKLVAEACSCFAAGTLDSAQQCADDLAASDKGTARGQFLHGLIACRRGNYEEALFSFDAAALQPGGEELFKRNRRFMADAFTPVLKKERAPDGLVLILAKRFAAADNPSVQKAVYGKPYWPRWNALRICQAAGKKADLVRVFILDLSCGNTMHTRIQAAYDLGDLGDRRAVPALREARNLGKSDPLVASAAAKVLREVFKEK